jgi:1-acyl-sn-glycerol-3-phosphate acyltransferase
MNWLWRIGAPLVRAVLGLCFRVRIEGVEHVPRTGAAILAPNHVSVLDGPALAALTGVHRRRATGSLTAAEAFHGIAGWILRRSGQIPIERGHGDAAALAAAAEAVRDGRCVGIFPEGRVSDDPRDALQRMRSGLTRIAMPTGAPVVPIGIWGTQSVWPRDGLDARRIVRRPPMAFVYGEPLVPGPSESPLAFRERFREALEEQVRRARWLAGA